MGVILKVRIDWDNDGTFTGTYDDVTADVMSVDWSLGFRQIYQPIGDESTCNIVLENLDRRYLPENSNSPLTGNIRPNRRISIVYDVDGTETTFWTGWIEFIQPDWLPGVFVPPVKIRGVGNKQFFENQQVDLPIFNDVTGDVIIAEVLKQAQVPPAVRGIIVLDHPVDGLLPGVLGSVADYSDVETGLTIIPQYGDLEPQSALEVIMEVTAGEQGRFFVARDGRGTWWNRHHLILDVSDDAIVNTQSGDLRPVDVGYVYGKDIANIIRVTSNPRKTEAAPETLWELDSPLTIAPSATEKFEARLRKANGQFAGSAGLTPTPTFSSGTAIVTVEPRGGVAEVTAVNASTTVPAVLSALTLVGVATTNQNKMDVVADDADSVRDFGKKEISIDLGVLGDFEGAKDVALFELARRKDPLGLIATLKYDRTFDGLDNAHLLDWTIGTRLQVVADELGHDRDYFVMSEKHGWSPGNRHIVEYRLEPANEPNNLILGSAVAGVIGTNLIGY